MRHAERASQFVVAQPAHLAQDECTALPAGEARNRGPDRLEIGGANGRCERVGQIRRQVGDRKRLAHPCVNPRPAFVPRDRSEPGCCVTGRRTAQHGRVRGKENLLRCVLRLDGIAKKQTAEPEHHPAVTGEQLPDKMPAAPGSERPAEGEGLEFLVVSVTSVVVASMVVAVVFALVFALVVVILVLALVVVGPCDRAGLSEVEREGHELPYER